MKNFYKENYNKLLKLKNFYLDLILKNINIENIDIMKEIAYNNILEFIKENLNSIVKKTENLINLSNSILFLNIYDNENLNKFLNNLTLKEKKLLTSTLNTTKTYHGMFDIIYNNTLYPNLNILKKSKIDDIFLQELPKIFKNDNFNEMIFELKILRKLLNIDYNSKEEKIEKLKKHMNLYIPYTHLKYMNNIIDLYEKMNNKNIDLLLEKFIKNYFYQVSPLTFEEKQLLKIDDVNIITNFFENVDNISLYKNILVNELEILDPYFFEENFDKFSINLKFKVLKSNIILKSRYDAKNIEDNLENFTQLKNIVDTEEELIINDILEIFNLDENLAIRLVNYSLLKTKNELYKLKIILKYNVYYQKPILTLKEFLKYKKNERVYNDIRNFSIEKFNIDIKDKKWFIENFDKIKKNLAKYEIKELLRKFEDLELKKYLIDNNYFDKDSYYEILTFKELLIELKDINEFLKYLKKLDDYKKNINNNFELIKKYFLKNKVIDKIDKIDILEFMFLENNPEILFSGIDLNKKEDKEIFNNITNPKLRKIIFDYYINENLNKKPKKILKFIINNLGQKINHHYIRKLLEYNNLLDYRNIQNTKNFIKEILKNKQFLNEYKTFENLYFKIITKLNQKEVQLFFYEEILSKSNNDEIKNFILKDISENNISYFVNNSKNFILKEILFFYIDNLNALSYPYIPKIFTIINSKNLQLTIKEAKEIHYKLSNYQEYGFLTKNITNELIEEILKLNKKYNLKLLDNSKLLEDNILIILKLSSNYQNFINNNKEIFKNYIYKYIENNPDAFTHISNLLLESLNNNILSIEEIIKILQKQKNEYFFNIYHNKNKVLLNMINDNNFNIIMKEINKNYIKNNSYYEVEFFDNNWILDNLNIDVSKGIYEVRKRKDTPNIKFFRIEKLFIYDEMNLKFGFNYNIYPLNGEDLKNYKLPEELLNSYHLKNFIIKDNKELPLKKKIIIIKEFLKIYDKNSLISFSINEFFTPEEQKILKLDENNGYYNDTVDSLLTSIKNLKFNENEYLKNEYLKYFLIVNKDKIIQDIINNDNVKKLIEINSNKLYNNIIKYNSYDELETYLLKNEDIIYLTNKLPIEKIKELYKKMKMFLSNNYFNLNNIINNMFLYNKELYKNLIDEININSKKNFFLNHGINKYSLAGITKLIDVYYLKYDNTKQLKEIQNLINLKLKNEFDINVITCKDLNNKSKINVYIQIYEYLNDKKENRIDTIKHLLTKIDDNNENKMLEIIKDIFDELEITEQNKFIKYLQNNFLNNKFAIELYRNIKKESLGNFYINYKFQYNDIGKHKLITKIIDKVNNNVLDFLLVQKDETIIKLIENFLFNKDIEITEKYKNITIKILQIENEITKLKINFNKTKSERKQEKLTTEINKLNNELILLNNELENSNKELKKYEKFILKDINIKTEILKYTLSYDVDFDLLDNLTYKNINKELYEDLINLYNKDRKEFTKQDYTELLKHFLNNKLIVSFYLKKDININVLINNLDTYDKLVNFNINKYYKTKRYYYKNYDELFNEDYKLTENKQDRETLEYLMYLYGYNIGKINNFIDNFYLTGNEEKDKELLKDKKILFKEFNDLHLINFDIVLKNNKEFLENNFLNIYKVIKKEFNNDYNIINIFFDKYLQVTEFPDNYILSNKDIIDLTNKALLLETNINDIEMLKSLRYGLRSGVNNESSNKILNLTTEAEDNVETIIENLEENKDEEYDYPMPFVIEKPEKVKNDYYMYMVVPAFDKLIYSLGYATNSCMTLDGVSADILLNASENEKHWNSYIGFKLDPKYKKVVEEDKELMKTEFKELNNLIEEYNKELLENDNKLKFNESLNEKRNRIKEIVMKYFIMNSFAITWIKGNQAVYDNFQGNNNDNVETDNINYHVKKLYENAKISNQYNYIQILKKLVEYKKENKEFDKIILQDRPLFVNLGKGYTNSVLLDKIERQSKKEFNGKFDYFKEFNYNIYTDASKQVLVCVHEKYNLKEPTDIIKHFEKIYNKSIKDIEKLIDNEEKTLFKLIDNNKNDKKKEIVIDR